MDMPTTAGRCRDCRFWCRSLSAESLYFGGFGHCRLLATTPDPAALSGDLVEHRAQARCVCYQAELVTYPDFGCTAFQSADPA